MKNFAPVVVRVGLSLVFLWFGTEQLLHTDAWVGLIPDWITSFSGISAEALVRFNGVFEIVFGFSLLMGYFTRVAALLLALHMLHITFTVGYNSVGIRDFGLSMAAISVFLYGIDIWCLDGWLLKQKMLQAKNP